jgi:hypothetical protein
MEAEVEVIGQHTSTIRPESRVPVTSAKKEGYWESPGSACGRSLQPCCPQEKCIAPLVTEYLKCQSCSRGIHFALVLGGAIGVRETSAECVSE